MKILIIKLGALGDVINTFPLVVNLKKHFNAEIDWLVAPLSYPLWSTTRAWIMPFCLTKNGGDTPCPVHSKR